MAFPFHNTAHYSLRKFCENHVSIQREKEGEEDVVIEEEEAVEGK